MSGRHDAGFTWITPTPGYIGWHRVNSGTDDWEAYWFCRKCRETWWGFVPDDQLCQDCRAEEDLT